MRAQLAKNAQFKARMIAQRRARGGAENTSDVLASAAQGVRGGGSALPHLNAIQKSFEHHDITGVQAFVGGQAKTASDAIGAEAYATGKRIAFGASPSLHTAAHEAAHVVQQRAGVQLSGGVGQVGDKYERHADAVADRVVQGKSAADLLDGFVGGRAPSDAVQRQAAPAPPTFQTQNMQKFVGVYPLPPQTTKSQHEALRILDRRLRGPWSSALTWPEIQFQAAMRVMGHQTIHQNNYALCGPAAVLQSMVETNPVGYARLVVEVFSAGTVSGKRVESLLLESSDHPTDSWQWADWMVLWAMRDVENILMMTHGSPTDDLSGGTSGPDLKVMIRKHLKVKRVTTYANWLLGDATQHRHQVNAALARGAHVYAMVDAAKLKASEARASFPTHWVRVDGPILPAKGGQVTMTALDRGSHEQYTFNGMDTIFEFIVAEL